jgi:flagellar protein FliT
MDLMKQFLLLSEKLYSFLGNDPENKEDKRDEYIAYVNKLLDARGQTITQLLAMPKNPLIGHEYEAQLRVLDQGIVERLTKHKTQIATDMQNLQKSKKSEVQYHNPYGAVQTMDGTYYDKRK